jgi:fumarylacetoacetate (FAA) hydrolase family protein
MTKLNLTAECVSVVVETLKAEAGVQKRWVKAADMLRSEPNNITSDALNNDKELRDAFKRSVILLSFSKPEQAIMTKPATALTDEEKITKRWVQQQIGSRLNRVVQHVKKAEDEEGMSDDERGARKVADLATRLKRDLTSWVEKIEKAEALTFSATQMIKHLKDAAVLIK